MPQLIIFLLGFLVGAAAAGQSRTQSRTPVIITVIDSLTHLPIADVHVSTSQRGEISGAEGELKFLLADGDVISFTHINYHPRIITYDAVAMQSKLSVLMKPNVRMLREIKVTDVQSEEAMKRKLLETNPVSSKEEAAVSENSRIINSVSKIAPLAAPTLAEQYFESLQGPKGVTILSSKGGGLIKAIKNISNPAKAKSLDRRTDYRSDPAKITPFNVKLHLADSISADSVLVEMNE